MGHPRSDRDREIGRSDLFQIKLDHHVLGDLASFGGAILQAVETVLHLGNAAFEACGQSFVGQGRADYGRDNLVQVGQSLDCIGEGLFVDLGVSCADTVADGAVVDSGEFEIHYGTPVLL